MIKNWKTTAAGVALALVTVATTFHWITSEQAAAINGVLMTFGFAIAKDNDVSGK